MTEVPSPTLRKAIRDLHGCDSMWVGSKPVLLTHAGATVWKGSVQIFDLLDHPTARRCYAWSCETEGGQRRFVTVLHTPPVVSPVSAVRAAIAAQHKEDRE